MDPGDGSEPFACAGPGKLTYTEADDRNPCRYTYRWSSTEEPDGLWHGQVTISWAVTWTSTTGQTGTLPPLTTSTALDMPVRQAQAVITR